MGRRIVITGAEVATCLGLSRQRTWSDVVEGRCGMAPMSAMESPLPPEKHGGQAVELPSDYAPGLPREVRYLTWTIERAMEEAGVLRALPCPSQRCGFVLGTTLHGMRGAGKFLRSGDFSALEHFLAGSTLEAAVADLAPSGMAATTCSACSSSLGSIILGVTLLRAGQLDLVICGGYDTISEYVYGGFNSLRLVADGPLRPFAKGRQGMKLAEGYGIVVVERAEDAARRGATALAEVLGCGESADAHHLTQPHPQGDGAARAMEMALQAAGISPAEVGLIAAHATGTPDNDAAEFAAMSRVFGEHLPRVPVVAFKSHLGHTLGGAGAVELILAMMAMREQMVPPCANVTDQEIEFPGLRLATGSARPARIPTTLNMSLGFGGANVCVVLGVANNTRAPAVHVGGSSAGRDVIISGVGAIVPGAVGNDAYAAKLSERSAEAMHFVGGPVAEEQFAHLLNARRVRRMSDHVKLMLAATAAAFQDAAITSPAEFAEGCCAILGTTHGSAAYSLAYYREIVKQGLMGANPMLFAEGVPNAASAHLSIMLRVKGACQTIIGTRTAGIDALWLAALRIADGAWDRAIVGAGEEHCQMVDEAYRHCGLYARDGACAPFAGDGGFLTGAAAVAMVLESREAMERRGGQGYATVLQGASSRARPGDPTWGCQQAMTKLGCSQYVISSANGTWIDRAELAAVRRMCPGAVVSSVYGHIAESFSAGPLLALAGPLLSERMMPLCGRGLAGVGGISAATGMEAPDEVVALCTDYTGAASAIRLALAPRQSRRRES